MRYLLTILLIFIIFLIAVIVADSNRFVIRNYEISSDKISKDTRIVFLSDLHNKVYGKNNDKLINAIREQKGDVILIGGDMLTAYPGRDFSPAVNVVKNVKDMAPLAYALGNHEYRAKIYKDVYGEMFEDYKKELSDIGVSLLDNDRLRIRDDMTIYGFSMESVYYKRFKHQPMADDYVEKLVGENEKETFSVLLAHDPDYFESYVRWEPDLILSGHIHGGVVRIPGWRGVISPMLTLFPKYGGGRFEKDGSALIVSRGLGMHTIPLRLFNPAEIVVIDIKKE